MPTTLSSPARVHASIRKWLFPAVCTALLTPIGLTGQTPRHLQLGPPQYVAEGHPFGLIGDAAVGPKGELFVADLINYQVLKILPDGEVDWVIGRKGRGPGEFQMPYRLAAHPSGGVAILDWGLGRISRLSDTGRLQSTFQLPFPFTQLDGFAVLEDGRFVIAGMTMAVNAARHSVHVFTDSLQYRYSFAPHAEAKDSMAIMYTGSGGISLSGSGAITFTMKRPFQIQQYASTGRLLGRVNVAAPVAFGLDDMIAVTQFNDQTFKSVTENSRRVDIPFPAYELPEGGFISGRANWSRTTIDLISRTGRLESTLQQPGWCVAIVAVDVVRRVVYCKTTRDDEPVLLRIPFSVTAARGAT